MAKHRPESPERTGTASPEQRRGPRRSSQSSSNRAPPAATAADQPEFGALQGPRFSWVRDDIECKLGLVGARFTRINHLLWMGVGGVLSLLFYLGLDQLSAFGVLSRLGIRGLGGFIEMMHRSPTQYVVVFFTFSLALMLVAKWQKTRLQQKVLGFSDLVPHQANFVVSPQTVDTVLSNLRRSCDDPSKFVLLNRIHLALSNLRNVGQIGDVDEVLQSQADNDDDSMESSYSLIKGLIWAIPVLGFIGTVQGLSGAIGNFGGALETAEDVAKLREPLQEVTGGLATAFETTFVALIAAFAMQLAMTFVRKSEEEMLDECKEYCQRHIIARLRLRPTEPFAPDAASSQPVSSRHGPADEVDDEA